MSKKVDENLYIRALKEIINISGVCPDTLYSVCMKERSKCLVGNFPRETEREEECWNKYLKTKLKEEGKGDNKSDSEPKEEKEPGGELPGIEQ